METTPTHLVKRHAARSKGRMAGLWCLAVGVLPLLLAAGYARSADNSVTCPDGSKAASLKECPESSNTNSTSSFAGGGFAPYDEYHKLVQASTTVAAHGPDLFGDQVNAYNNTLSFVATDISLPGNSSLPLALKRTYSAVAHSGDEAFDNPLADWELDVPRISGVFAPTWSNQRCTSTAAPSTVFAGSTAYNGFEYWQGNRADMPGGGELLVADQTTPKPTSGGPYVWVTSGLTYFSCLPAIKNGTGEGFLAITSDGTKYWFDWMARYSEPPLASPMTATANPFPLTRKRNVLYATRVEDRFGNWVTYTYTNAATAPARLTSMQANDGRQISLSYNTRGQVASATAAGRTWTYQYAYSGTTLSTVILPDTSRWMIDFRALSTAIIDYDADPGPRSCDKNSNWIGGGGTGRITHPAGAVGEFDVAPARFGRSNVPKICVNWEYPVNDKTNDIAYLPRNYEVLALAAKRLSGPGIATTQQWLYSGGGLGSWAPGTGPGCQSETCMEPVCVSDACAGSSSTTVTGPGGTWTRYTFGNSYRYNEGKLLNVARGTGPTAIMQTAQSAYELAQSGQPFSARVGRSLQARSDGFTSEYLRPQRSHAITQDGVTFSSTVNSFDAFARPLSVTKSSTLGFSRTEDTSYSDYLSTWVLGQTASVTCTVSLPASTACDGDVVSATTYHPTTALPWTTSSFGKLQSTMAYNTDGTLATVMDGLNRITTLSNWKRRVPQAIGFADGTSMSAVVNDNGWVTSVISEVGAKTCYGYDAMGRLANTTYPSETTTGFCDTSKWAATSRSFVQVSSTEYYIPAGHWRETTSTGNATKITYYDGMWRPLLTREYDAANITGTERFSKTKYDAVGRLEFATYPLTPTPVNPLTHAEPLQGEKGSWTLYDALSRVTSVSQDSELGLLTSTTTYNPGFTTTATNPRGQSVQTTYRTYDQPSTDLPLVITAPEGATTTITRDALGKPTSMTRSGGGVTPVVRDYAYNNQQELIRSQEPETGATIYGYDAAGNLTFSAAGLPMGANWSPSYPSSVTRTYDARNRLTYLTFPDGNGNQHWTYADDGLPNFVTTNNGGNTVTNVYTYNKRRLLTGESMVPDTVQLGWAMGYGYNSLGQVTTETYPASVQVSYTVNALGQTVQASVGVPNLGTSTTVATNASYYPNGGLKQFTYGNGIIHTMTQNARQLPSRSTDGSALDLATAFDENGNVASVTDYVGSGIKNQSKSMVYDNLDRLTSATSPMFGTASYTYNTLDNLKTVVAPNRNHTYIYDAKNRLTNVTNTVGGDSVIGLTYDVQGNLANKNGVATVFDYGNRLRSTVGMSYRYDALGRRVRADNAGGQLRYSFFSSDGRVTWQRDEPAGKRISNVYLAGSLVAELSRPIGSNTETLTYLHTDALGSPIAKTDASGTKIETSEYEPYGKLLNRPNDDRLGYTGHVMDSASGLTYMQQRYYDPGIGRFLSVDPVTAYENPVGAFNRYYYANNNPYANIDPDGRECFALNSGSPYCTRSATYRVFDGGVSRSTRFFGAAAATTRFLANLDIPIGSRVGGWVGVMPSSEARSFLGQVSASLYDMNVATYRDIASGKLGGAGLDAAMVHKEQSAVQKMLDGLPADQRSRIVDSINDAFANRDLATFQSDKAYGRILGGVEKSLGRAIDFGKQSDREAIGNALIKDLRQSGGCTTTGTRISQC